EKTRSAAGLRPECWTFQVSSARDGRLTKPFGCCLTPSASWPSGITKTGCPYLALTPHVTDPTAVWLGPIGLGPRAYSLWNWRFLRSDPFWYNAGPPES